MRSAINLLAILVTCSFYTGCASFQSKPETAIVILSNKQPPGPLWGRDSLNIKYVEVNFKKVEAWKVISIVECKTHLFFKNSNIDLGGFIYRVEGDVLKIPLNASSIPINLTLQNITLKQVFDELSRETGWTYHFDEKNHEFVFDMNSAYRDKKVNGKLPDYIYRRGW